MTIYKLKNSVSVELSKYIESMEISNSKENDNLYISLEFSVRSFYHTISISRTPIDDKIKNSHTFKISIFEDLVDLYSDNLSSDKEPILLEEIIIQTDELPDGYYPLHSSYKNKEYIHITVFNESDNIDTIEYLNHTEC